MSYQRIICINGHRMGYIVVMAQETSNPKAGFSLPRLALLAGLLGLMVAFFASGGADYLSLAVLAENRQSLADFVAENFFAAIGLFVLIYAAAIALSVPGGAILTLSGGFLFGVWLGTFLVLIAATSGAVILFLIAKTALGEPLARKAGPALQTLRQGFAENAFSYLLFLRLMPVFPFWLVNLAPALLGVPLSIYVMATLIGIIPGSFAFAFLGTGLDSILVKQQQIYAECIEKVQKTGEKTDCTATPNPADLVTTEILAALGILALVALLPIVVKKIRSST